MGGKGSRKKAIPANGAPPAAGPAGVPEPEIRGPPGKPMEWRPRAVERGGGPARRKGHRLGWNVRKEKAGSGRMAGVTGLEPAASGGTGRRSNQLSYTPVSGTR